MKSLKKNTVYIGSWVGDGWPDCLDGSDENQDNKQSLPEQLVRSKSVLWSIPFNTLTLLKFSFSEKATKMCAIGLMVLTFKDWKLENNTNLTSIFGG